MFQVIALLMVVLIAAADQLTKWWAQTALADGPWVLWDGIFELRLNGEGNTGGAWGILSGQQGLLIAVTSVTMLVLFLILMFGKTRKRPLATTALVMILGGGIGNLIDRVLSGAVTDFLRVTFIDFPTFNVADCFIVVGSIFLVMYLVFFYDDTPHSKRKKVVTDSSGSHGAVRFSAEEFTASMRGKKSSTKFDTPATPSVDENADPAEEPDLVPLYKMNIEEINIQEEPTVEPEAEPAEMPTPPEPPVAEPAPTPTEVAVQHQEKQPEDKGKLPSISELVSRTDADTAKTVQKDREHEIQDILDSIFGNGGRKA